MSLRGWQLSSGVVLSSFYLFKNFMFLLTPDHMVPVSGLHLYYAGVVPPAEVCEESGILDVSPQEGGLA